MITYACNALLTSLSPLIGAELGAGHAVSAGWADDVDDAKIAEWTKAGLAVKTELEQSVKVGWDAEWMQAMRKVGLQHPFHRLLFLIYLRSR